MTKRDLLLELKKLLDEKRMYSLDGLGGNSNKSELQNAIDCLRCTDEQMAEYLIVVKLKYPNLHRTITRSDYLHHSHNRLFVYRTARQALAS